MRLDDQAMCHAGREALLRSAKAGQEFTRIAVFYDNEEIGSSTPQGAVSPWLGEVMERIVLAHEGGREHYMRAVSRSNLVSADMAHAINPNHASRHDDRHSPVMGKGPVLKLNASMRYATDATGWELFERACAKVDVPVQRYVNRSDLPCGSTIGPLASSRIGLKTIDVGNPIFAMHSIRETQGTADHEYMIRALTSFLDGA
jgi:aspartyl aminopeptidase